MLDTKNYTRHMAYMFMTIAPYKGMTIGFEYAEKL